MTIGQKLSGVSADLANYRSELEIATQDLNLTEQALVDARSATGFLLVSGTDPNVIEMQNLALRQLDLKSQSLAAISTISMGFAISPPSSRRLSQALT